MRGAQLPAPFGRNSSPSRVRTTGFEPNSEQHHFFLIPFIYKFLLFERGFSQQKRIVLEKAENLDEDQSEILLSVEAFVFEVHGEKSKDMKVHVYR